MNLSILLPVIYSQKAEEKISFYSNLSKKTNYCVLEVSSETGEKLYYHESGLLVVFLSVDAANYFAASPVAADLGEMKPTGLEKTELVNYFNKNGSLFGCRFRDMIPFYVDVSREELSAYVFRDRRQIDSSSDFADAIDAIARNISSVLKTLDPVVRRTKDPHGLYDDPHTLIDSVMKELNLSNYEVEEHLSLEHGFLETFRKGGSREDASIEQLAALLDFFHLKEFLYLFRDRCLSVDDYLKKSNFGGYIADAYKVRPASSNTAERFFLESIKEGTDPKHGGTVYLLEFSSERRTNHVIVCITNPIGCKTESWYEIPNYDIAADREMPQQSSNSAADRKSEISKVGDISRARLESVREQATKKVPTAVMRKKKEKTDSFQ